MRRILLLYYIGSPAFLLLDLVTGINVRVAALGDSPLRLVYYGAVFACGLVGLRLPKAAPAIGMFESAVNVLLLVLAVLLPIYDAIDVLAGDTAAVPDVLGMPGLVNLLLSGFVLVASFHKSRGAVR